MQQIVKLKKPKARVVKIWDYHAMEQYLEQKYKCDFNDYLAHQNGIKSSSEYNVHHRIKWENAYDPRIPEWRKNPVPNYGMNQEGLDFYKTREGILFWDQVRKDYNNDPNGKAKEIPYFSFWHHIIDSMEISNGVTRTINWAEFATCGTHWQQEICNLFVKEFGNEDMEIEFSW